jgi:putative sterol carrier protein
MASAGGLSLEGVGRWEAEGTGKSHRATIEVRALGPRRGDENSARAASWTAAFWVEYGPPPMTTSSALTPLRFPSAEWCAAYKDAINANPGYRAAGKDWTHGAVAMVVMAEPSIGIAEDLAMWLDMHQGECRACRLVSRQEADGAPFVIVATYARWKEVIRGQLDPTKGMMQNKLKLTKGHMPTMVKYVTASKELVESTSRVPTAFAGE